MPTDADEPVAAAAPDFGASPVDSAFDDLLRTGRLAASRGRASLRGSQHEAAVRSLTSAVRYLSAAGAPPTEESEALTQRSLALTGLARRLRSRPAAASERAALFGQDPTVLAELALKDARRAAVLLPPPVADAQDGGESPLARAADALLATAARAEADALFLLERFEDAEAAYLEALSFGGGEEGGEAGGGRAAAEEGLARARRELGVDEEAQMRQHGGGVGTTTTAAPVHGGGNGDNEDAGGGSDQNHRSGPDGGAKAPAIAATTAAAAAQQSPLAPARRRRGRLARDLDEADCALCAQLLLEPTTTPCGHSFCRGCLSRALDFAPRCPACRSVLHAASADALAVSVTLRALLSASYPEEYARREREAAAAAAAAATAGAVEGEQGGGGGGGGGNGAARGTLQQQQHAHAQAQQAQHVSMPLFVMTALLPGERMALNIFEPRYRLLIRRCLEGSRRLGTAQGASHAGGGGEDGDDDASPPIDGLDRHFTEAEIAECSPQPDGRYHVELVGRRVVRMDALTETDGYRIGSGRVVAGGAGVAGTTAAGGAAPSPSSSARELAALAARVDAKADAWLSRLRAAFSSRGAAARLVDVLERVGRKPALRPATRAAAAQAAAAVGGDGPLHQQPPQEEQAPPPTPELSAADAAAVAADAEALSWWAARLLVVAAPAGGEHADRSRLLRARGTVARLRLEERGLEARLASTAGCAVM